MYLRTGEAIDIGLVENAVNVGLVGCVGHRALLSRNRTKQEIVQVGQKELYLCQCQICI